MREALLELRIVHKLRHPHIVAFIGCAAYFPDNGDNACVAMVFEMCGKGSLAKFLHESQTVIPFAEKIRMVGCCKNLLYPLLGFTAVQNVMHRGFSLMRPSNI